MEAMTAAHRTLPFGTRVSVANLSNSRHIEVRINDRGPFVKGRIIDVSRAAARKLGFTGTANVRIAVLELPKTRALEGFAVQVGAFQSRDDAESARVALVGTYPDARLIVREGDQTWRVLVGLENSEDRAEELAMKLSQGSADVFVVRADSPN
jgi:rare lipoprotein A